MGAVAAIAIGGLSLLNASQQADALDDQANFQKKVADTNTRVGNMKADDALRRGEKEARDYRTQIKGLIGSQRAALAAQGVALDFGSALEIQEDTAMLGELDAMTIENNAFREAMGYKVDALNSTIQGVINQASSRAEAQSTRLSGLIDLGSSFVKAGGKK